MVHPRRVCVLAAAGVTLAAVCGQAAEPRRPPIPDPAWILDKLNGPFGQIISPLMLGYRKTRDPELRAYLLAALDRLLLTRPDGRWMPRFAIGSPSVVGYWLEFTTGPHDFARVLLWDEGEHSRAAEQALRKAQILAIDEALARATTRAFIAEWAAQPATNAPALVAACKDVARWHAEQPCLRELTWFRTWPLQTRWPTDELTERLVSLRDVAFVQGHDDTHPDGYYWNRAWRADWPAGRFTLLAGGHELTFTKDSAEAILDGRPKPLRRACEQVYFDLYVPLADLTELLGGTLRRPREGELTAYTENLPVGIWILELPGL